MTVPVMVSNLVWSNIACEWCDRAGVAPMANAPARMAVPVSLFIFALPKFKANERKVTKNLLYRHKQEGPRLAEPRPLNSWLTSYQVLVMVMVNVRCKSI